MRSRLIYYMDIDATVVGVDRRGLVHAFPILVRHVGKRMRPARAELREIAEAHCATRKLQFVGYRGEPEFDPLVWDDDDW